MANRTVKDWMDIRGVTSQQLEEQALVQANVLRQIIVGQWTASPVQRERIANALGVTPSEIRWGHSIPVDHIYGHGPQFGRSP